jgi:hypothetical protein
LDFGFSASTISADVFARPKQVIRIGIPPVAIDLITSASGVDFGPCFARRQTQSIDGIDVCVIHLDDLTKNRGQTEVGR